MKNNPKTLTAWTMYDWANSVHSLTITSAIFPIYYPIAAVMLPSKSRTLDFFGFQLENTVLYSYAVSVGFLLLAFSVPLVSAISDYTGNKKAFMRLYCYLGAISCMLMYFFVEGSYYLGTFAFLFSIVGWGGSIVFYNSYLPEIATEDQYDRLSARGFTMGYIGSVILLIQNLTMVLKPEWYGGITGGEASRISFLTVGIWWIVFAQYSFHYLPDNAVAQKHGGNWIFNGFKELKKVFHELENLKNTKRFLSSFFFYNMGAQTVMYLGALFGSEELKLPSDALIVTVLLIQLVAIVGAYLFAKISENIGNTKSLSIIVVCWVVICIAAYFVTTRNQFYILATGIGFVMGGIQSLSRSTYAKLIPEETPDTASYFSFYDVCDRLSTVIGTFMFGLVNQLTGSMRMSVLFLTVFFIIGLVILSRVPSQKVYR
ncbi:MULTISPECIES: MFS transporter [unclassified Arcicella]|uniref:MFS transporter n=1 Tax=unclassified Arcicella TaxID=2644986 RepID=UPI00285E1621|nr:MULTISPECIES: MFS transporter [unclassified Arcicella]MDR6564060.1 UMF1 family MFS transporter [Arcicella sp. BE51]MDR6813813.1 UMF1 family MFS transporter [Arcicella sp. BE140]MDR6825125.1 UMF1 family MFS transporter [Arcicella sp. BE139]